MNLLACPPPQTHTHTRTCKLFWVAKRKKGNKGKKEFQGRTIKDLSTRSKRHPFSHFRVSRIQRFFLLDNHDDQQYFSLLHGSSTLKLILPALLEE